MAYADFIYLNRTTASDKTLCDKALLLPKIQSMMNINLDCFNGL